MRMGPLGKSCARTAVPARPSRPAANRAFIKLDATCVPPVAGLWSWTCRLLAAHLASHAYGPYCENLMHLCRFRICLVVVEPRITSMRGRNSRRACTVIVDAHAHYVPPAFLDAVWAAQ